MGLHAYTPVFMKDENGKPKITSLRAVGNYAFGLNMAKAAPATFTKEFAFRQIM